MQTLANLRLLAELMEGCDFDEFEDVGRILDNNNKKLGLEMERIVKARNKAEKKAAKEEAVRVKAEEAMRVKEEARRAKEERLRIREEVRRAKEEERRAREERMRIREEVNRARVAELQLRMSRQREYDEIIAANDYEEFGRFGNRLIMEGARNEYLRMMRATELRLLRERLPKTETKRERREKLKTAREDGIKECGVCYNSKMCVLNYRCEHSFCKDCLVSWTKGCPICRSS